MRCTSDPAFGAGDMGFPCRCWERGTLGGLALEAFRATGRFIMKRWLEPSPTPFFFWMSYTLATTLVVLRFT